jgi:threonine/homoserine/homoserine lactone efflux protein
MWSFLITAIAISLSGVMAPGPATTAAIGAGTRNRHAGALIAVGHGIVEFPLMGLIVVGLGDFFTRSSVQIAVGLAGGLFLIIMGMQLLMPDRDTAADGDPAVAGRGPIKVGVLVTAGNPYFLIWWATVGLALTTQARQFGMLAFALFAVIHWLCDLFWLEILTIASFAGAKLMAGRFQQIVMAVCGSALALLSVKFLQDAISKLLFSQ